MTANQINYWKLQEDKRHNVETERLSDIQRQEEIRHNLAGEGLNKLSLEESVRHNTVTEGEAFRSNVAREQENVRSNMAYEIELNRSNVARESENVRHNKASEALGLTQVQEAYAELGESRRHNQISEGLSVVNTEISRTKEDRYASVQSYRAREEQRHNTEVEKEQKRSNMAKELENQRSNLANEKLRRQELIVEGIYKGGTLLLNRQRNIAEGLATFSKLIPLFNN